MLARNFKKITDLIKRFAHHQLAPLFLFIYSVLESLIIPIPADMMLVPMTLGYPKRGFMFATIAALGSTVGGLLGYGIGYLAFHTIAEPALNWLCQYLPNSCPEIVLPGLQSLFKQYGVWVVALSSFAPLVPYRFTILAAGLGHMALFPFLLVSFLVHWARYMLVTWLVAKYGKQALTFIKKKVSILALVAFLIALVVYFILV
jgi:membrane protein YqaA with SNARE-associated domain